MIRFTKDHEWIDVRDGIATVGITDYAQKALGDVVFVELPGKGSEFAKGDEAAVVESVKAASEVYAPIAGEITEVNETLETEPGLVNNDPQDGGWFFRMTVADEGDLDGLMDEEAYDAFVKDLD